MSKTKQSEVCPCGSGKKYKNCCHTNDMNRSMKQSMNNELYRLHQNLILTVTNRYDELLQEQYKKFDNPLIADRETREIYRTGLTAWIISFVSIFTNKETILERYYRSIQRKLSPLTRSVVTRWFDKTPSVYKVISIDSPKKHFLLIQDLKTEEKFYVPFQDADDFIEGSLLIGILIPFVKHQNFFFTTIKLFHRDHQFYVELLNKYSEKDGGLNKHYPQFLAEALNSGLTVSEWQDPLHEEVANLFAEHMSNKGFHDTVIMSGIEKWNHFCSKKSPTIQRAEPYAAALDYYIQREFLNEKDVKQVDLAEEYDISPSTLSRNYRQLVNELNDKS